MPILYFEEEPSENSEFEILDERLVRHLRALRYRENDEVEFFRSGKKYICKLLLNERNLFKFRALKIVECNYPKPHVSLAQAIIDKENLETIIRLNIPLFVSQFIFFRSERSNFKISEKAMKRLLQVGLSVSEQSEVCFFPDLCYKNSLEDALEYISNESSVFVLDINATKKISCFKEKIKNCDKISIFVGPEGGFSEKEKALFEKYNAQLIKLSSAIFRSEIAGFASIILLREILS